MTTIKLRHQGPLVGPVPTFDVIDSSRPGDMAAAEIELALGDGLLDADDLAKVRSIMTKYVGGGITNSAGSTRNADARVAGRKAAAVVRANVKAIQAINLANRAFWANAARH